MLLSVPLIICWRDLSHCVSKVHCPSVSCLGTEQKEVLTSPHPAGVWSHSPEGTVWMREKRAVWKEQLRREIPRKTAQLYCQHQGHGDTLPDPFLHCYGARDQHRVGDRAGEVPGAILSALWEPWPYIFLCIFFFSLAEAAPWGWLQLLPNFWGKVPSAYGKESIWPTVFISQPGFFLAWQITHCLLRSNTSAKLEFLKVKDLIYHSTEKKKGSEKHL